MLSSFSFASFQLARLDRAGLPVFTAPAGPFSGSSTGRDAPASRRLAFARPALAPKCEFISARALRWIVFASLAPRTNARLYRESTVEPDPGFHHNEVTR